MTNQGAEQWKNRDSGMDSEHGKLHQMVSSMVAVVMNDPGLGLAAEAVDVLLERLRLHFRMEEQLAASRPGDIGARLKEDHQRLLRLLSPIRAAIQANDMEHGKKLLGEFLLALEVHDREVDAPLNQPRR